MKKSIFLLTICFVVLFSSIAHAKTEIKLSIGDTLVYINETPVEIDASPVLRNGRTMVPIRVIAEALGAEVEWTSWMTQDAVSIKTEDQPYSYCIVIGESEVIIWTDPFHEKFDPNITINNQLDSPAFVENNRTYLPLRFVAESLGAEVYWDNATQTVTISK